MFYRKCSTPGYISVHYFRFEHFLFDHFVNFILRQNYKVLSYKVFLGRDMLNKYIMFSKSKIIVWIIVISILTKIIMIMIFSIIKQPYFRVMLSGGASWYNGARS